MGRTWVVIQYDNREIKEENQKLIDLNKAYCSKHGYDHIMETKLYDMPPWWIKIKLVKDILNTHRYEGALWLDTDAVIHNQDKAIDSLILEDKSIYYSGDAPLWNAEFNAGVWLVKDDIRGNEIMEKWMNSYNPKDWSKKDNKWVSSKEWAGPTYEQGAFIKYVKPHFEKYIHVYPWQVFQSYEASDNTFAMHFASNLSDDYLPGYNLKIHYKKHHFTYILIVLLLLFIIICFIFLYYVSPEWLAVVKNYIRKTWIKL